MTQGQTKTQVAEQQKPDGINTFNFGEGTKIRHFSKQAIENDARLPEIFTAFIEELEKPAPELDEN